MAFDIVSAIQFVTIVDEMSFTRAAARLGVAQPWISKRIRLLEEQLGFRLLERTTRSVALTEKGAAFYEAVEPIAAAAAAAARTARALGRAEERRLRIGVPPYGDKISARTKLTAEFAAEHPEVSLELEIGWTPQLLERATNGHIDAAFCLGWPKGAFRLVTICHLQPCLHFGANDPLCGREFVCAEELRGRRIARLPRGLNPSLWDALSPLYAEHGIEVVQVPEMNALPIDTDDSFPPLIVQTAYVVGEYVRSACTLSDAPRLPFHLAVPDGRLTAEVEHFWQWSNDYVTKHSTCADEEAR
jgi:DNA-binding transcriptional LysR family regulator